MTHPLELQNISKTFGTTNSGVKDISFSIAPGEGFSLLGPSGCGKSTTLRLIGGFEAPDELKRDPSESARSHQPGTSARRPLEVQSNWNSFRRLGPHIPGGTPRKC